MRILTILFLIKLINWVNKAHKYSIIIRQIEQRGNFLKLVNLLKLVNIIDFRSAIRSALDFNILLNNFIKLIKHHPINIWLQTKIIKLRLQNANKV